MATTVPVRVVAPVAAFSQINIKHRHSPLSKTVSKTANQNTSVTGTVVDVKMFVLAALISLQYVPISSLPETAEPLDK